MNCPKCKQTSALFIAETRAWDAASITRRRGCNACGARWTTDERVRKGSVCCAATTSPATTGSYPRTAGELPAAQEVYSPPDLNPVLSPDLQKQNAENYNSMGRALTKSAMLTAEEAVEFAVWYAAFPRKRSKLDAQKAWGQTRNQRPPLAQMLRTLEWQIRNDFSLRDPSRIPYPATYLRDGDFLATEPEKPTGPVLSERQRKTVSALESFVARGQAGGGK